MLFRRYLQQGRESCRVRLDAVSYLLGDVLVDKQYGNILALLGELVECGLDSCCLGLCVDDEEVLLAVWGLRDVLKSRSGLVLRSRAVGRKTYANAGKKHACYCILRSIRTAMAGIWSCAPHRQ